MRRTRRLQKGAVSTNNVNKTLYIPLYGKSHVSKKGLFLDDKKAEAIWEAEGFPLRGKSSSKWLAYYMGIRAAVFDEWAREKTEEDADAVVIHIGCGMDSRALRVGTRCREWYDVDFSEVIKERKKYFSETENYKMIVGDARESNWLEQITVDRSAIVIMEGVSMYLTRDELSALFKNLNDKFEQIRLLTDCYTTLAAKASKYKNPINDVGVTTVYGIDDPKALQSDRLSFVKEYSMTPKKYVDELRGAERFVFEKLYAGGFSKKLYRLYEYGKV